MSATAPHGQTGRMTNAPVPYRPAGGRVVAGVAAGLAVRWKVSPALLRAAFVVLTLFGGLGAALYLGALVAMPAANQRDSVLERVIPASRQWTPAMLAGIVVVAAFVITGALSRSPLLFVLLIVGWVLSRREIRTDARSRFQVEADAWSARLTAYRNGAPIAAPDATPALTTGREPSWQHPAPTAEPVAPKQGRPWLVTLVCVGAALTLVAIADAIVGLPNIVWPAGGLMGLAVALLITASRRRPRGAIALGVITSLVVLGMAFPETTRGMDVTEHYTSLSQLPTTIHYSAGSVTLDLSGLTVDRDADLEITMNAGELIVILPAAGDVAVDARADMGELDMGGQQFSGLDLSSSLAAGTYPSTGHLTINVALNIGHLEVRS